MCIPAHTAYLYVAILIHACMYRAHVDFQLATYVYVHILIHVDVEKSNFEDTRVTSTPATVRYLANITSGCGPVLYYNVTLKVTSDTSGEFSDLISGTNYTNSVAAVNRECTSYTISVAAVNRAGSGLSSIITVATLTGNEGKIIIFNVHTLYNHVYNCLWLRGGLEASKHPDHPTCIVSVKV